MKFKIGTIVMHEQDKLIGIVVSANQRNKICRRCWPNNTVELCGWYNHGDIYIYWFSSNRELCGLISKREMKGFTIYEI